ncbi:MAG: response regulator [Actinobacteria bacterium]|nr:MAG: response regulator [Actinomycetota bacterium]
MSRPLRVLFVEDVEDDALLLVRKLSQAGFEPVYTRVDNAGDMRAAMENEEWDIAILDYNMPHFSGPAALKLIREMGLDIPAIIISGTVGEDIAVETLKFGADDYILKNHLIRFVPSVERALRETEVMRERRQAVEDLRESETRYRELAESIQDIFFAMDQNLRYTYWNRASESLTGIPAAAALGKSLFEIFPATRGTSVEEAYRDVLATGMPRTFVDNYTLPDRDYWFEVTAYPSVSGLAVFARDITDRRRSEERLALLSRSLLNLGADPEGNIDRIVAAGLDILEGDIIKYWRMQGGGYSLHTAFSRLEGYEREAASLDRGPLEQLFMWHSGDIAARGEEAASIQTVDPDVTRYGLRSLIGHPVMLREDIIGCLCLFAVREREFSREETDLASMLARAISIEEERWIDEIGLRDFIDITSHELRHPITIMKGYAITLKESEGKLDPQVRSDTLEAIDRGADRLDALLGELLDTTRIERGKFTIERQAAAFDPIVALAVQETRRKHPDRETVSHSGGGTGTLQVDQKKVYQLLVALLDNAAKFSPAGTDVEIEAGIVENELRVSVSDRGEGVPAGERERIFERFYQVGDVVHHSIPGIGLGLYIARQIVNGHHGRIWYEPRAGGGSVFHFTLPLES